MRVTGGIWPQNTGMEAYQAAGEREKYKTAGEASESLPEQTKGAGQTRTDRYSCEERRTRTDRLSYRAKGTEIDRLSEEERAEEEQAGQLRRLLEEKEEQEKGFLEKLAQIATSSQESKSDFKMKASGNEESVGQLAAMLSRAETRMDVQQVSSRAMRALTNLKMTYAVSNGDEAKKIAQQIRRMEKLIKRIQKKLRQLGKEEQMELQQKRAREKLQEQKEKEIKEELQTRRKKRRREEREYAKKELARDGQSSAKEMAESMAASVSSAGEALPVGTGVLAPSVMAGEGGSLSLDGGAAISMDPGGEMAVTSVDVTV